MFDLYYYIGKCSISQHWPGTVREEISTFTSNQLNRWIRERAALLAKMASCFEVLDCYRDYKFQIEKTEVSVVRFGLLGFSFLTPEIRSASGGAFKG